jgi:hypothetical protein
MRSLGGGVWPRRIWPISLRVMPVTNATRLSVCFLKSRVK